MALNAHARILGVRIDRVTQTEVLDAIFGTIAAGERGYLCTMNAAMLVQMGDDERLARCVSKARFVVADGQSLVWASRLLGDAVPERVAGVDLIDPIAERAAREGLGVYLLGSTPETCLRMAERLHQKHPALRICGHSNGYFPPEEERSRVQAIVASGASILFVAMGVPRQEYFIESNWEQLGVSFAMAVGGSFDVLTGRLKRAPRLLQKLGLEWSFRLAQEPRRLWKRYLSTNSRFLLLMAKEVSTRNRRS
jgi:N-acetylglucosaminyldiphosphoundecaprenol N-acetyl-beta-D-mannosaminyltransferase